MNTQKVAITIPADLVVMIDDISKQLGMFRSKNISTVLREKVLKKGSEPFQKF
jgi:metal-responsive CopG/Arc/MetJ family transcriptional regulator